MYSVLLVDDEMLERQGWRRILEKHRSGSVRVIGEARNGREAVELAKKERPDLVLMDVKMPGLDGIKAGRLIKEFLPGVKIIVISAYDEFSYAQEALKFGAVNYLLKPVQPAEMLEIVDQQLSILEKERRQRKEEESFQAMFQKIMPYLKIGFIFEWLSGNVKLADELHERAEFLGLKPLPQLVMVVNIDNFLRLTAGQKEIERQILKQKIYQKITVLAEEYHQSQCIPLQGDKYGVLIMPERGETPEKVRRRAARLAETIRREIEKDPFIPATVTIGIGRVYTEGTDLHLSYQEALKALEYKLYTGGNQVIHIDDVLPFDERVHSYPFPLERELLSCVRIGDGEQARYWLTRLLNELFSKTNNHPDLLKTRILELLVVLSRQAIESGASSEEVARQNFKYTQELWQKEDLGELHEWIFAKVENLIKLVQSGRDMRQQDIMKKILAYIHSNYHRDITLEEVAGAVFLSPCYLSRIFKQVQGVNFIDYLTSIRLEKAKVLLRSSGESIAQIAGKVGYQDPKYFSTVFKKHEGCTPSEYRSRHFPLQDPSSAVSP